LRCRALLPLKALQAGGEGSRKSLLGCGGGKIRLGSAGNPVRLRPRNQITAAVADGSPRRFNKSGAAASYPPVLQGPDGIAEKLGRLAFLDHAVQILGIVIKFCHSILPFTFIVREFAVR